MSEDDYQPDVICANGRVHYSAVPNGYDWISGADRISPECAPHRPATAAEPGVFAPNCNSRPGRRDVDGHGWVGTLLGWPWPWRCYYCGKRRRGHVRPDKTAPTTSTGT